MILKDKIVIVTGGSRGIGKTVAQVLVKAGCRVIAVSRSLPELNIFKEELQKEGFYIDIEAADVSDYTQVQKMASSIIKKFNSIDILVNAAGIYGPIGLFSENDIKKWSETIQINLMGTVNCVHAVLPVMIKNGKGKIINFSGGGAVNNFPNFSSYATSKIAIVRFTETLAEELKPCGIQINAIAPGAVNTKLLEESLNAGQEAVGEKFYEKIVKQKKEGGDSPELAASLILFLISDQSFGLTGKLISAKWDNWKEWDEAEIERLNNTSEYTLRRIDNKYFEEIKK